MSDISFSGRLPMANDLKSCNLWLKGSCRFGNRCKFSHGEKHTNDPNVTRWERKFHARTRRNESEANRGLGPNENAHTHGDSNSTLDPKTKKSDIESIQKPPVKATVCNYWKAGKCRWGDHCRFRHDDNQSLLDIINEASQQGSTSTRPHWRQREAVKAKRAEENRKRKEAAELAAKRAKEEQEKKLEQEKAAREAQEEAAKEFQLQLETRRRMEAFATEQDVVLGSSLITYGAGLDVRNVIAGFDLCRVTIKNLPQNARQGEIEHIFTQQGIERSSFFIRFKDNGNRQEATVLMKAEEGQAIAVGLQGIEFHDQRLTFEVSGEVGGNAMGSSARNSDCLTVYWRAPSAAFIVTYSSMDEARKKNSELDGAIYQGQRIKAQMNQPPPGAVLRHYVESSIKLSNFPIGTLADRDLVSFVGSCYIKALTSTLCGLQDSHDILHRQLLLCRNIKIETYQNLTPKPVDGNVRVKVQFETWQDAKSAYESINGKRFLNSPVFHASLPNPLQYTIIIPKQQYEAQKKQWDSLSEKKPDRDAHVQTQVGDRGGVFIRVLGQDKKAVGSLKVRVEHMVAGETLGPGFWHPSFLAPSKKAFFDSIYRTKGVYVRSDSKTRLLKIYGGSDAMIEEARNMVKEEVNRLAKLEMTELLDQASVGFFVRGGLGKLRELLGQENATMSFNPRSRECHVTVKGGEEARRQLNRLIAESRTGGFVDQALPGDIEKETCPVCTDEISHPEQLNCGHAYCSGCLQHFLESAPHTKAFPLACIGDEGACKTRISIPEIRRILQPQAFQALVEVAFRSYLDQHGQELKFCKTPDCQQIYRHSLDSRVRQCPSCFSTICSACDDEAHEGMTCQERRIHKDPAEQDRLFNEWTAGHAKRCPECRSVVEKSEGCNHMTCLCGAHFCWQCGETFSAATIYQHMDTAHGGMYEQTPVWVNPDNAGGDFMLEQRRLWVQAQRQQEIQAENAARVLREENAWRAQIIERQRRLVQPEVNAALRRRDELEARRREEAAQRRGSWCIVM